MGAWDMEKLGTSQLVKEVRLERFSLEEILYHCEKAKKKKRMRSRPLVAHVTFHASTWKPGETEPPGKGALATARGPPAPQPSQEEPGYESGRDSCSLSLTL